MVDNPANIELIPWVHYSPSLYHREIINYIRTQVHKNSYLALEITPHNLNRYNLFLKNIMHNSHDDIELYKDKIHHAMVFAYIDVLSECYKKNIKIIPIENKIIKYDYENYLYKYADKKRYNLLSENEKYLHEIKDEEFRRKREEGMAEKILQTIKYNPRIKQLYVLAGANHIVALKKDLKQFDGSRKLNLNVNTSMFSDKKIEQYILKKAELRDLKLSLFKETDKYNFGKNTDYEKDLEQYNNLLSEVSKLYPEIRDKNYNPLYADIVRDSLQKKYNVIKKRINDRLETKRFGKRNFEVDRKPHKPI